MWTALTSADVRAQLSEAEAAAVEAVLAGTNKLDGLVAKVIAQIREDILAGDYPLHAAATYIPGGLVNDAVAIARWKLLLALPGYEDLQSKVRENEYKEAMAKLRTIAAGKRKVEPPEGSIKPSIAGNWNSENKIVPRIHPLPRPGIQSPSSEPGYSNESDEARNDSV